MALSPFRRLTSDRPIEPDRPRRQDGVLAQEAQGQTVLLRLDDGGYYALEEVGARIWELCDGERDLSGIVAILCSEFDAPEKQVMADVVEFVAELRNEDLLA
jgi:coenzyme PQQ biosynthesis protein PqqD